MKSAILAFEAYRNAKTAKRAFRKGWRAAADFMKKQPFKCVGIAFGTAFGIGTATGWFISRR
jgi:ElaB/YqjD/DUF883 family membrane-anchored ribosome-binding protein